MSREDFEKWAEQRGWNLAKFTEHLPYYADTNTTHLFVGWQACEAEQAERIAKLEAQNAELVEALEACKYDCHTGEVIAIAKEALAKVKGA